MSAKAHMKMKAIILFTGGKSRKGYPVTKMRTKYNHGNIIFTMEFDSDEAIILNFEKNSLLSQQVCGNAQKRS